MLPGRYTPQVQEAVTRLASKLPYAEAQEELARLWGIRISTSSVRSIHLRHGQAAEQVAAQQQQQLQATQPVPTAEAAQLTLSADGAFILLTSGEWREVRTLSIGQFEQQWDAKQRMLATTISQLSYVSRMETASQFEETTLVECHRRGVENATTVVAVADGAPWIQSLITYHAPDAVRVIDFAHACAYLASAGKAVFGEGSPAFVQWFNEASTRLRTQPPQQTVARLRLMLRDAAAEEVTAAVETAISYLEARIAMIDYPHFRERGYPIGSGCVESAHKVVLQSRIKRAGMRWAESSVNPMLCLRTLICNRRWDERWQQTAAHVHHSRLTSRLARYRPASSPPVTFDSLRVLDASCLQQPTAQPPDIKADHPWQGHNFIFRHRPSSIPHKK